MLETCMMYKEIYYDGKIDKPIAGDQTHSSMLELPVLCH